MPSLGETLREARQEKGASLEDVEAFTHIRAHFVEALEEERFGDFPSPVYVRGFLRNYALFLGLEPQAILEQYAPEGEETLSEGPQMLAEPLVASPWLHPVRLIIGACLIVLLVGLGLWWSRAENRSHFPWPNVGFLTSHLVAGSPTISPTVTGSAVPVGGTRPKTVTSTPVVLTPTDTPVRLPSPTVTGTPLIAIRVAVVVSDTSWVEVISDGDHVFANTMNPGATGRWEARNQLAVRIGNAGGVFVTVNDRQVGLLGQVGEVVSREWIRGPEGKLVEQVPTPLATYTPAPEVVATGTPGG
ncbi:MAG: helix-turn-helix domain-containing protein [Chloroflexi bacterium]|nr:helix-turn-helix domain-containing protein [Chloroflexota bacterium]